MFSGIAGTEKVECRLSGGSSHSDCGVGFKPTATGGAPEGTVTADPVGNPMAGGRCTEAKQSGL